jgi:hypothetical protein
MRRRLLASTTKWTLTGAAVGIAALWVFSYWQFVNRFWGSGPTITAVERGRLVVTTLDWARMGISRRGRPTWYLIPASSQRRSAWDPGWLPTWGRSTGGAEVIVPLWTPLALAGLPAVLLWRADGCRRARARHGRCASCDYDRRGLARAAACPECGASAPDDYVPEEKA